MIKNWNELTPADFERKKLTAILCVGSCEQHSSYLPLGTDSLIGESIVKGAGNITKTELVMLPTQNIGYSPHHRDFNGCLTLQQDVMFNYLLDICFSVFDSGVSKLIIINSHGGNQSCLQTVVNELGSKGKENVILVRYWDLISEEIDDIRESSKGGMGHAGEFETSLMLYLYPELVIKEKISMNEIIEGNEWHNPDMFSKNQIYIYKPFIKYSFEGYIGQSHYGSKEKGEVIYDKIINKLSKLIDAFSMDDI